MSYPLGHTYEVHDARVVEILNGLVDDCLAAAGQPLQTFQRARYDEAKMSVCVADDELFAQFPCLFDSELCTVSALIKSGELELIQKDAGPSKLVQLESEIHVLFSMPDGLSSFTFLIPMPVTPLRERQQTIVSYIWRHGILERV